MATLSRPDLRSLSAHDEKWCISVFMPTHSTWPDNKEDAIRFGKLVSEVEARLITLGERPADAKQFLEPLDQLARDQPFWQQQRQGLAVFLAPDMLQTHRLPIPVREQVMVAERFAIKPLLPLLTSNAAFFILAVTEKNGTRLVRADRFDAEEMPLPELPHDAQEASGLDEPERGKQFHAGVPVGKGRQFASVVHTTGVRVEDSKQYILELCQQINRYVTRTLRNETAPLVLAGVDSTLAIYRKANTYPHVLDEELRGAVQRLSADDLRERAWPLIENKLAQDRQPIVDRLHQYVGTGSASVDLKDILIHAFDGTVSDLFVQDNAMIWGRYNHVYRHLTAYSEPEGDDEDLLDLACVHTLRHRGTVHAVPPDQMPQDVPIAAVYRY
jgi:hypothetical protein